MAFNSLKAKNFLLILFCVAAFAGCSKINGRKSGAPITLTVWESDNGPDLFIQEAGEIYTRRHPNITIKYVHIDLEDVPVQIALDGPVGVGPDLFAAPHENLSILANGGHIMPTENAEKIKSQVFASCSKALTYNGTMYGYPVSAKTYALFYNKNLISQNSVPKTWEELVEFSEKFNAANSGKYGFVMDVGNAYYTTMFITANNNRPFGTFGTDTSNSNLSTPDAVRGMEFFQGLRRILDIPAESISTFAVDSAFAEGTVSMHVTGIWNAMAFEEAGLNFGVVPLPSLPGESQPCASLGSTRAMFVSSYSERKEEAVAFAEFLLSPEMQRMRFLITGELPSVRIKVENPYLEGLMQQLEYAFPVPSVPQMGAFWEAMGTASKDIWDGGDVKEKLEAANAAIMGL